MRPARGGVLAVLAVVLLLASGLAPLLVASAAPTLPDNTVVKGTLDDTSPRADYNFTARTNVWTVVASNNYQNLGSYRHDLRVNASSINAIATARVGSYGEYERAGFIAINGFDLASQTQYTVSQVRGAYTPSFALQLRRDPTMLARASTTVLGNLGTDGIVMSYQIDLQRRDTLDLRLQVPPEWTYNYHLGLFLLAPADRYYVFDGEGGVMPVAQSSVGENREQALTFLAMDPGFYCVVVLNLGMPDDVQYTLKVGLNGKPLPNGALDEETLTDVNLEDYYAFTVPMNRWSAVVAKARGPLDYAVMHSLHWPTADSNSIAYDELTDAGPAGIIAIDGHSLSAPDSFFARERYDVRGGSLPFTIQYSTSTATLASTNNTTAGQLTVDDIFRMYEVRLQKTQTVDLRLRVDEEYNYDYDLGMYVFAPGGKYHSISGQLPEYSEGPVASSRAGQGTEQDAVFTCPETGFYAIVIVNFDARDDIPFTLQLTIQGRTVTDDVPVVGDLNAQNRIDLLQFTAARGAWTVVGCRLADGSTGSLNHRLYSTALDTNPLVDELLGYVPAPGGRGSYELRPLGLLGVDGRQLASSTTYYMKEEVSEGAPRYVLELESTPRRLTSSTGTLTGIDFRAGEFLQTYTVDLAAHQAIDVRASPPENYTYDYELGMYILGPGSLYHGLVSDLGVVARSVPGPNAAPALLHVAETAGTYLILVANLGPLSGLEYGLRYALDGFNVTLDRLVDGTLDPVNGADAYRFQATPGDWTLAIVRLPEAEPASAVVATVRWPSLDSVALATATLDKRTPMVAFLIDGDALPSGAGPHYLSVTSAVPGGRTVRYSVQVSAPRGNLTGDVQTLSDRQAGALYTGFFEKGSTVDLALRVPADFTYAYDLGLYLFAPGTTYLMTGSAEDGPESWSRDGGETEQEVVYTAPVGAVYAMLVLSHAQLSDVRFNLSATVDGAPLEGPARGYVDGHNGNEHYRFTASANQWSVVAARLLGAEQSSFLLKLLTSGLSTNPIVTAEIDPAHPTGVIAINGWDFVSPEREMYLNASHKTGYSAFVVHADANATDFGEVGHAEAAAFGEDQILYLYQIALTVGDHLEVQLAYDQGNWSSDVLLDLLVFEPYQSLGSAPIKTVTLMVTEGTAEVKGLGELIANKTGTYAFVMVNRGPIGPMGFSLGVYRRSVVNQPPMYPAILKASTTKDRVSIEWAPNQEADFEKYEIYISESQTNRGNRVDTITTQTLARYTIERLDAEHTYYVTVVVYDTEGLWTQTAPYKVKTKAPAWLDRPEVTISIAVIAALVVTVLIVNYVITRQRRREAEEGAGTALPPEVGEAPPLEAPRAGPGPAAAAPRPAAPVAEDATTRERRDALDYMKKMMGD